jgi:glycerol-3-phosphate acyltransferase PlsX
MGGDQPPHTLYDAVMRVSKAFPACTFFVFSIDPPPVQLPNVQVVPVVEAIEMGDSPLTAVRKKKNSSMAVGIRMLRDNEIDAFVSAGNTGALVATSRIYLSVLPGITTPALLVLLPIVSGYVAVLDVGAGISFKPTHLIDYAKMGSLFQKVVMGVENPRIGLLNTGVEEIKGTELVKIGFKLLADQFPSFIGNIEGREVFSNQVDVLVTDGFTGNIFLKTCEGVSSFIFDFIKKKVAQNESLREMLLSFQGQFNYSKHPGAILAGVDGLVIKCHGASNATAFESGIRGAIDLVNKKLLMKMKEELV